MGKITIRLMNRAYVICHMASSVDGRIISENWGDKRHEIRSVYEQCHNSFEADGWMVGRVTMEKDFTGGKQPEVVKSAKPIPRQPFVGDAEASSFAIAVDARGKLGWDENEIDGDHLIEVLTENVADGYLQYLQDKQISYIFAGKDEIDFEAALIQLHDVFHIKKLMLEGGGGINGSVLNAGLIDELSLLILPIADGTANTATTFDVADYLPKNTARDLKLIDVKKLEKDVVWLKYKVQP